MPQAEENLEALLETYYLQVYRLSFLLSCHGESAREIAFQAFLYAGADSVSGEGEAQAAGEPDSGREESGRDGADRKAQIRLLGFTVKTCRDYYLRKMRRITSREQVQDSVAFPLSDAVWTFLHRPFQEKAVSFLCDYAGCSPEEIGEILHISAAKASRAVTHRKEPLDRQEVEAILPEAEETACVGDEIFLRFEERNVRLENRLRDLRLAADQSIVWVACVILVLFAIAAVYSASFS